MSCEADKYVRYENGVLRISGPNPDKIISKSKFQLGESGRGSFVVFLPTPAPNFIQRIFLRALGIKWYNI